jgi:hypothetical protein
MSNPLQTEDPDRFATAIRLIDEANAADPTHELVEGRARPRELVYSERLTDWVLRLQPDASEPLLLAARCQHIRRWEIPRDSYPMTRDGYLKWKEKLKRHHAEIAGTLLREAGYPEETIQRVQSLNLKKQLKQDPDCQTLEDALCLVFLEHQFADLAAKSSDEKMITALRKSWAKMSARGHEAAMTLNLSKNERRLLETALG